MRKDGYREFGLLCPHCESHRHGVYDVRSLNGVIRRHRQCVDCLTRFKTVEKVVSIIKNPVGRKNYRRIHKVP